ncbi:hypothetical protein NPIL_87811 [Nephila pilipes]|uniref:Uncharacterized protein n=1 Tax=Nephila pilipes TaxID=299642 RepID=A0A8X6P2U6_NEPPI|nr:hypothetical protein NPIL_87811 [Nephila pilipes]
MLRTRGLTATEAMSLFESLSSDLSDAPVKNSSDEEMSTYDSPVSLSSGFHDAENVESNSDEDMEEQKVARVVLLENKLCGTCELSAKK